MKTMTLGRTGLEVGQLALGGLFVMSNFSDLKTACQTVQRAADLGINYIDTAPTYGDSEAVLGKVFAEVETPFIVSTKLGGRPKPFEPQNRDCLMRSFEESLRLLGRDQVEILMIHEPDRPRQYDWWTDFAQADGPVFEFMCDLKSQGLIKHLGLGGTTVYEMAQLLRSDKFDVVLTAFNYSLLWREAGDHVLPVAQAHNVGVVIGSPLQQGALARPYEAVDDESVYWLSPHRRKQFKALYELAADCQLTLPELAMRFVISNPAVHCVLTGARSAEEVERNAASISRGKLPDDLLTRLDEIHAMQPCRPYEEPFGLGWHLQNPKNYKGPGNAA